MSTTAQIKQKIDFSTFNYKKGLAAGDKMHPFASQVFPLERPSEAIVFFKQKYEKLFYKSQQKFPSIQSVEVVFTSSKVQPSTRTNNSVVFEVNVNEDPQWLPRYNCNLVVSAFQSDQPKISNSKKLDQFILPFNTIPKQNDASIQAKQLLQKKFWMKISANLNTASAHVNDLVESVNEDSVGISLGLPLHDNWENQETVFSVNPSLRKNQPKEISPFEQLDQYQIIFYFKEQGNCQEVRKILNDYIEMKVLLIGKISNSVLGVDNLSLLRDEANIQVMAKQIEILSEYLRKFEIDNLPGFKNKTDKFDSDSYYNWRNLRNGIHKSISTEPGYLEYTMGDKTFRQPVGILNVLMQIKSVNYEDPSIDRLFKWQEFRWDTGSLEDNLQKIYDNRQIYVRFQFNEPYGDSPGGMAVLEIWPPYCCSPIHNHGEAYGVIKVLANQICVQNFKDLNFLNSDRVPYQQNIYQENQYTWLSEFSFGIHRLINTTNQTTLCLQAYQGHKGSKQFFEFIFYKSNPDNKNLKLENSEQGNKIQEKPKKKGKGTAESGNLVNLKQTLQGQNEEQLYCQYYPQHDWKNFLNWKAPQGHEKEFQYLQDYVEQVKIFYGDYLQEKQQDRIKRMAILAQRLNTFQDFVLIMKKQFEIFDNLFAEKTKSGQKITIKFTPLDDYKFEDKKEK